MAHEAWARYNGPKSRAEFLSEYMRGDTAARSKKVLKVQVGKWDKKALNAGKRITAEEIAEILIKLNIRRTPSSEQSFADTIERTMPGGIREYGEFKFAGTVHRPDFYVNKDIVFEYKIIYTNTELHTAIGQALIYTSKYKHVFLILFDARHGYDAVNFNGKELQFLFDHEIWLVKYPLSK